MYFPKHFRQHINNDRVFVPQVQGIDLGQARNNALAGVLAQLKVDETQRQGQARNALGAYLGGQGDFQSFARQAPGLAYEHQQNALANVLDQGRLDLQRDKQELDWQKFGDERMGQAKSMLYGVTDPVQLEARLQVMDMQVPGMGSALRQQLGGDMAKVQAFASGAVSAEKRFDARNKAPQSREVKRAGQIVMEEFDPNTRDWREVGRSAQFAPTGPRQDKAFGNEAKLRGEFTKAAKDFVAIRNSYATVKANSQGTAAGDVSMIFAFMKMLDPLSVVREGEFATAQNAAGVPDRVRNVYNRLYSGERLTSEQRQDFLATAERVYASRLRNHESLEGHYRGLAKRYGVSPENVVLDYRYVPSADNDLAGQPQQVQPDSRPPLSSFQGR